MQLFFYFYLNILSKHLKMTGEAPSFISVTWTPVAWLPALGGMSFMGYFNFIFFPVYSQFIILFIIFLKIFLFFLN